ncbi:MAG: fatty acid CoA ligase family protein [Anaerolineae bacterium]|nr:fatty acid CoA ligase family protein [Anaerolineae bacterium]
MERYNVGQTLADTAARLPDQLAISFPAGRDWQGKARTTDITFRALNRLSDQYAHGLAGYGIAQGDRVLMLLKPSIDFIAVIFAVMKTGAVPVIIDPGMGRQAFLQCVSETEPVAMIGIPIGHVLRKVFPKSFKTIKRNVTAGPRLFWGGATLTQLRSNRTDPFIVAPTTLEDEAAVAFTSGSTGIPKGVVYLHGIFKEIVRILRHEFGIAEKEVHLAGLLIFALFNPALGVTTIIPDFDPRAPAKLNPKYFVQSIQNHGVTMSIGSPTIFKIVGDYCQAKGIDLPTLKHVYLFGAAVRPGLIKQFSDLMPNGKVYTPFGATEALPITCICEDEILAETGAKSEQGAGVCVGYPVGDATIRIIPITDYPIEKWDDALSLRPNEIGEIAVKGSVVTRRYLHRPKETQAAKIYEAEGTVWHRMGDTGYCDAKGRVWVCGRKSHRVETLHGLLLTVQCEAIFNQHPQVRRTALVGVGIYGEQEPVIIVEMEPKHKVRRNRAKQKIIDELLALGAKYDHTKRIKTFLFHDSFPVDVRHNAKIQREKLADWAKQELRKR